MTIGPIPAMKPFPEITRGSFIRRLNRFAVLCSVDGNPIMAHLPNPGRLRELLLPGRTVYLSESPEVTDRKTRFTAVAVERDGTPVFLHTHQTNTVVKWLIEHHKIPGLENASVIKPEITIGHSRFDFLLHRDNRPLVLEVKSCTLFGGKIAMFPDAVTARGRRHLIELGHCARAGTPSAVVILAHWPHARYFLPDYHTDLAFSRTFLESRETLEYTALAVEWTKDLTLGSPIRKLAIPWDLIEREAKDCGSYIIILHIRHDVTITVGRLGPIAFPKGYYLYVGSAKTNLQRRMARHLRKRKNFFWHIDYLRDHADHCLALPVRASTPLEHDLALSLSIIADWCIPGFGASDCSCETHLFGMTDNPVDNSEFIDILVSFRMTRLEKEL